jgi:hypothetical protein
LFSQSSIDKFFETLIHNSNNISSFVDEQEIVRSDRLGINYTGVTNKFLISYDIDEEVRISIIENNAGFTTKVLETKGDFSKVEFDVPSLNYSKLFYFKSGKFISPSTYYARDWKTFTSRYFIFKVSEPKYFNDYCVDKLDAFVDTMCVVLGIDESNKLLLEREKIYYILCKDENEIKIVSGFNTRGIFITAFDEIITTYNTHYHELAHLLINFKLKNLSLYTLPFFMEGFAVAVGGRGGMSTGVVTDIGYYLQVKGILTYDSILTNGAFYKEDASVSYPVAGLYNQFLLKTLGSNSYLDLYKHVNGNIEYVNGLKTRDIQLPDHKKYSSFLREYEKETSIPVGNIDTSAFSHLSFNDFGNAVETEEYYECVLPNNMTLKPKDASEIKESYMSKKFDELFPGEKYLGEKYIIKIAPESIELYNLYTNELSASHNIQFSISEQNVIQKSGFYYFWIRKDLFDGNILNDYIWAVQRTTR